MLAQLKVLILLELAGFFLRPKAAFQNKSASLCMEDFFQRAAWSFELVAVGVRGEALQESITHAGRCKPPEHSVQINASSPRQERLLTYIYLSAANRLSLKTLHMCDEGQHGAIFQAGRRIKVQVTREF